MQAECTRAGQPGLSYTWTLGPGLRFVNGSTGIGLTQQIGALPGFIGVARVSVTANRPGFAASAPLVQQVEVGNSRLTMSVDYVLVSNCRTDLKITASGINLQNNFRWVVDGTARSGVLQPATATTSASSVLTLVATPTRNEYRVQLSVNGTCPTTLLTSDTYEGDSSYDCTDRARTTGPQVYPNPADTYFMVRLSTTEATTKKPSGTHVALYNSQGTLVRQQTALPDATEVRVATADLPAGLYGLVVRTPGAKPERHNVLIEHAGGTAAAPR